MKLTNVLIILPFVFCLSCERSEPPECNCGIIEEHTTGVDGTNPFPTNCNGIYDNLDNYTMTIRNNCSNNLRVVCNHNPTYHWGPVGNEWCDYNSTDAW